MSTTVNIAVTTGIGADTSLWSGGANNNFGVATTLYLDSPSLVVLLRFDLSGILSTATCDAAALKLTPATNESSETYNLYKITDANGDWVEGTKNNATAGTGEPCWNKKAYNTVDWAGSAGMSTAGTDYVNTVLATFTGAVTAGTTFELTFNASGLAILQDWFGDAANNGFLLKCEHSTEKQFCSGEYSNAALRPILSVTYTEAGGLHRINMNAQMQSLNRGMHG